MKGDAARGPWGGRTLSDIAFVIARRQQHFSELTVAVINNSRVFWQFA
jgi:hypothetical protein